MAFVSDGETESVTPLGAVFEVHGAKFLLFFGDGRALPDFLAKDAYYRPTRFHLSGHYGQVNFEVEWPKGTVITLAALVSKHHT